MVRRVKSLHASLYSCGSTKISISPYIFPSFYTTEMASIFLSESQEFLLTPLANHILVPLIVLICYSVENKIVTGYIKLDCRTCLGQGPWILHPSWLIAGWGLALMENAGLFIKYVNRKWKIWHLWEQNTVHLSLPRSLLTVVQLFSSCTNIISKIYGILLWNLALSDQ